MNTTAEVLDLVRQIGSPGLKMMLDVKSMCSESSPIPDLIREAAPFLAHFHANDVNRRGRGSGPTDFIPIFQILDEIGYHGYVSVEVFDFSPSPQVVARDSLHYMRRALADARTSPQSFSNTPAGSAVTPPQKVRQDDQHFDQSPTGGQ